MKLEVLDYLKKYIQNKYPMYYDAEEQAKFLNFVSSIASDKKFKTEMDLKTSDKSIKETLQSGEMDHIIDDLINTYAQIIYTKIWANLDGLSSRIKNVILKESQKNSSVEIIGDHILDKICQEIALGIIKNMQDDDYTIYLNGSFNEKFVEDYGYYLQEYKKEVSIRVEKIIKRKIDSCNFKVTEDTYLLILSGITDSILHDYKYNDIINGFCDKEILSLFNFYRKKLKEEIENYVTSYITSEIDDLLGVSVQDVLDAILSLTIVKGEISAAKLLDGKLDELIKGCVKRYRKKLPSKDDAISHIYSFIFGNMVISLTDEELSKLSEKIYLKLRLNNILDNDIVSGNYDDKIKLLYENEIRIDNSVEKEGLPKKIKVNKKRRKMYGKVISLALAGTLTISAGKLVFDGVKYVWDWGNSAIDQLMSQKQMDAVDEFDNYKYNFIFTKYNDSYEKMTLNAADFYNKVSSLGDEYRYLGFYRMYKNVMADKLAIMDSTLPFLKSRTFNNPEYSNFYDSISRYECYLDFAKDSLLSMGCEQIKDSKYQEAINVYKEAMEKVWGDDYTPMDYLIVNSPECVSVIKEIMHMYTEYS